MTQEDWMNRKWRPAMGWTYMAVCIFDFMVAPVVWAALQASLDQPITQWRPLTLEGAGLFHMAMGAVLGVAAWSRGQEKIQGAVQPPQPPQPTTNPVITARMPREE